MSINWKQMSVLAVAWGAASLAAAAPIYSAAGFSAFDELVTFDNSGLSGSPTIQGQFSSEGVKFDKSGSVGSWKLVNAYGNRVGFAGKSLQSTTSNSSTTTGDLSIFFTSDVDMAGGYFLINASTAMLTFGAYNNGALVGSYNVQALSSAQSMFLGWSGGTFDELRISNLRNRTVMLDSLRFSHVNAVPEPSSIALAGLVLGGLFTTRKRWQR